LISFNHRVSLEKGAGRRGIAGSGPSDPTQRLRLDLSRGEPVRYTARWIGNLRSALNITEIDAQPVGSWIYGRRAFGQNGTPDLISAAHVEINCTGFIPFLRPVQDGGDRTRGRTPHRRWTTAIPSPKPNTRLAQHVWEIEANREGMFLSTIAMRLRLATAQAVLQRRARR
jgi:hypothetical protein